MRPIQLVILLVAFGAAGGAGLLAMKVGARREPVAQAQVQAPSLAVEDVLVAAQNIRIGGSINAEAVKWVSWPKDNLPEGLIIRSARPEAVTELKGDLARTTLYAGEPIREAKLVHSDRGFLSAILPSGKRAVAVRVNVASTAGGFILPEDRVDIMLASQNEQGTTQVRTIMHNIRVLAIDQHVEQSGEDQKGSIVAQDTATLELTPDQSEQIVQAQQQGSISLALRSITDANANPNTDGSKPQSAVSIVKYGVVSHVTTQR